ncbi:nucleotide-binding protein [Methylobacterium sp. Gmos1]
MKKVAILSQKGGTGKTTLSLHLAVASEREGRAVALLDIDPQASAASWSDIRNQEAPSVTPIPSTRLKQALALAERSGAALVIIDTAPHSADAAVAVAEAADLILIPCRPGILDIKAIEATARIVRLTRKPAFVVLTQVPPRAPRLTEDAIAAVQGHGLEVAPIVIHQRSAYAHALTVGQTAQEYEPEGKAAEETGRLFEWAMKIIKL